MYDEKIVKKVVLYCIDNDEGKFSEYGERNFNWI